METQNNNSINISSTPVSSINQEISSKGTVGYLIPITINIIVSLGVLIYGFYKAKLDCSAGDWCGLAIIIRFLFTLPTLFIFGIFGADFSRKKIKLHKLSNKIVPRSLRILRILSVVPFCIFLAYVATGITNNLIPISNISQDNFRIITLFLIFVYFLLFEFIDYKRN